MSRIYQPFATTLHYSDRSLARNSPFTGNGTRG